MSVEPMLPWPPLPDVVAEQLAALAKEDQEEEDANPDTGEITTSLLVRPWDLAALTGDLEPAVWGWLDNVVMWLNYAYAWQDEQTIPACWPLHPGLANDLAALAFGRIDAYQTSTAAYVGRWHSDLEDLHRRMAAGLGENRRDCLKGDHRRGAAYSVDAVRTAINEGRKKAT